MEPSGKLDLDTLLRTWEESFKQSHAYTKSDIHELKSHLLDIYDEMLENGLDEEEAFFIASKRLGRPINWEDEFKQTNQPFIQTRKALLLIAGIIFYYLSFYFTAFIAKSTIVIGSLINIDIITLVLVNKIVLGIPLLLVTFFFISLVVNDDYLYQHIEKMHINARQAIYAVVFTLLFALGDRCMVPLLKNAVPALYWKNKLWDMYMYFEYIYLLIIIIGFGFVYKRYFKNSEGPLSN